MKKVRVRYAPSPTGLLHIGNARTAIFNYLFARHYQGDFIIRIEDTDIARNVETGEKSQLENLSWLGVDWDESPDKGGPYGPYRQLDRLEYYQKYGQELLEKGFAYKDYKEAQQTMRCGLKSLKIKSMNLLIWSEENFPLLAKISKIGLFLKKMESRRIILRLLLMIT